jgi:hypothetical protein
VIVANKKLGLHTMKALQSAAAELQARRPPPKPSVTRRFNEAHKTAMGITEKDKK